MKKGTIKTSIILICLGCGKSFRMYKYRAKSAKYCSMKCLKLFKRVCKNGHDTAITGRYKGNKGCKECGRERCKERRKAIKRGRRVVSKKKYCVHGHNTFKLGRNKDGACIECIRIRRQKYYTKHKKELLAKSKKAYQNRKKQVRLWGINYRRTHKKECQKRGKQYRTIHRKEIVRKLREKRHRDLLFRLQANLRSRLYRAIKNNQKVGSAVRDLGCSIAFFKKYIAKKFHGKMSWKNYGKYWHLDHKIALYRFDLSNRKQLLMAINYKNMQPLTIPDHGRKSAKETRERSLDKSK